MTTVLIPKANERDLEDVDQEVKNSLVFHTVSDICEVIELALLPKAQGEERPIVNPLPITSAPRATRLS